MSSFDVSRFAACIKARRGKRSMRDVSKEAGVSASTLSRLENEEIPNASTLLIVCEWLGVEPENFYVSEKARNANDDPMVIIEVILRSATSIDDGTIDALMIVLRSINAYADRAQKKEN